MLYLKESKTRFHKDKSHGNILEDSEDSIENDQNIFGDDSFEDKDYEPGKHSLSASSSDDSTITTPSRTENNCGIFSRRRNFSEQEMKLLSLGKNLYIYFMRFT